jgi:hypothetical protein
LAKYSLWIKLLILLKAVFDIFLVHNNCSTLLSLIDNSNPVWYDFPENILSQRLEGINTISSGEQISK